jgi:quinol monooxygenase YgiN
MIFITIKILVPRDNHPELTETIQALLPSIRNQSGFMDASLSLNSCHQSCKPVLICLREEWESRADVDEHLRSNDYAILLGAVSVLRGSFEIEVNGDAPQS